MLIHVEGTNILGSVSISSKTHRDQFLSENPDYIEIDDFQFEYPTECYEYVSDNIQLRSNWEDILEELLQHVPEPEVEEIFISPVEFKLLLTVQARVAIRASDDPYVQDFHLLLEDPRLTKVGLHLSATRKSLEYISAKYPEALTEVQVENILSNQPA